jgi:hypothetical protein
VEWTDKYGRPVFVIFYENLTKNPGQEIENIVQWIKPIFEPNELPSPKLAGLCAQNNQTGSYKRIHSNIIFNPYSTSQRDYICDTKHVWNEKVWGKCDGILQRERKKWNEVKEVEGSG